MTREEAIKEFESELEWAELNMYPYISKQKVEADKMAIKALKQELRWIPVNERLPEEGVDVLACFYTSGGNYKMMVSRRRDYNYWSGVGRTGDMVVWMPLPTPYEPQESDLGDYPDAIHNQFDNMTGSMNL